MALDDPAPLVSLAFLLVYGALAVGWRARLQRRLTGDSGLRLSPGSPAEWIAGAVLVIGLALSVAAPVADLAGGFPRLEVLEEPGQLAVGVVVAALGIALTIRAQLDMGESWRIGVHVDERAPLVTRGVFGRVRNPIFSGVLLTFGGLGLLVPNVLAVAGWAALLVGLEIQVRFVEEPFLARLHGARYLEYAARAGRFVPGLGRLRPPDR